MLRALRFLAFASLLLAVLARHAPALRRSVELLASPMSFSPTRPCVPGAVGVLAVALAYAVWLSGGTLARWRTPLALHAVPLGGLLATLGLGPLPLRPDGGGALPERTVAAMEALGAGLEKLPSPCRGEGARELLRASAARTGLYSFGRPLAWRLIDAGQRAGPVEEAQPGDRPGSLYLACDGAGRAFWISALAMDGAPRGRPAMLRDGVGRVAVLRGEAP